MVEVKGWANVDINWFYEFLIALSSLAASRDVDSLWRVPERTFFLGVTSQSEQPGMFSFLLYRIESWPKSFRGCLMAVTSLPIHRP